jgi:hypothetical protein
VSPPDGCCCGVVTGGVDEGGGLADGGGTEEGGGGVDVGAGVVVGGGVVGGGVVGGGVVGGGVVGGGGGGTDDGGFCLPDWSEPCGVRDSTTVAVSDTEALVAATGSSGTIGGVAGAAGSTVPGVGFGCLCGLGVGSVLVFCPFVPVADGFGDVEVEEGPESGGVGGRNGSAGASD